jgi:hypothetical protein
MYKSQIDTVLASVVPNPAARKKMLDHGYMSLPYPTRYNLPSSSEIRKQLSAARIPAATIERLLTRGL